MMKILLLIKDLLLFKLRSRFHSKRTIIINAISAVYILSLYSILIHKLILFFYNIGEETGLQMLILMLYVSSSFLLLFMSFAQYIFTFPSSTSFLNYLHLPISTSELIYSRVITTLLLQYALLVVACAPIAFYIYQTFSPSITFYFLFLLIMIITPLIPNSIGLFSVFLYTRKGSSIKKKRMVFIPLSILSILGIAYFIYRDVVNLLMKFKEYTPMYFIYPPSIYIHHSLGQEDPIRAVTILFLLFLLSILFLILTVSFGSRYDVINFSIKNYRKKQRTKRQMQLWDSSKIIFFIKQEISLLLRRPVLYLKGVVIAAATPLICIFIFSFNDQTEIIKHFSQNNILLLFIILICFSILTIGWNPIAISSFSREKNEIAYKSTMPISIKHSIIAKVLASWIIHIPIILLYALIFDVFFNVSSQFVIYYFVLSIVIALNGSLICIIFDIIFPILIWNEEQELFKGRTAITSFHVYNSLYAFLIFVICYLFFKYISVNLSSIFLVLLFLMLLYMLILYKMIKIMSTSLLHRLNQYYFRIN